MAAQLYYTPSSCGAANYISAYKAGLIGSKVEAFEVDIGSHTILTGPSTGKSFYEVNPKGNVPALVLADGTLLNEGAAVLQWIADQAPESGLAPANGTSARYLLQAKLNYLSSEVHASIGPLFNPAFAGEARAAQVEKLKTKLKWVEEKELANGEKKYILGDAFTVADAYFYIILTWTPYVGVEISKGLQEYRDRVGSLDFVTAAHAAMAAASPKKA